MKHCFNSYPLKCKERWLVVLLVLTAIVVGTYHLYIVPEVLQRPSPYSPPKGWPSPNLVSAVMLATGRGFTVPTEGDSAAALYPDAPELSRFLRRETMTLTTSQIPEDLETSPPLIDWEYRHRYLLYTVGLLWRIFGITWHATTALRIAFFSIMTGALYGLLRLGMGRFWSTLMTLAVMLNLTFLSNAHNLRDFSKGPFILVALLIMGYLLKHPLKRGFFLGISALLGLVIGFGVGFRADVLICLPPALIILLFSRRPKRHSAVWDKFFAALLLCISFLAPASQVMGVYSGGSLFAHDLLMGFATKNDDMLGINRASYEKLYVNSDLFVTSMAIGFNERTRPDAIPPFCLYDERPFLLKLACTFPGDLVTRGYASVWHVARGGSESRLWGLLMAFAGALVLVIIAHRDLRMGWLTLFLFFYFGGYLSLQAEQRHAFHLYFIPYWITGFLLQVVFSRRLTFRSIGIRNSGKIGKRLNPRRWNNRTKTILVRFVLPVLLLLTIPLYTTRAIQTLSLESMLDAYSSAELTPVPVKKRSVRNWTMFERETFTPVHAALNNAFAGEAEYWVAEFTPGTNWRPLWVHYIGDYGTAENFTHGLWLAPSAPETSENMKYFFPVIEFKALSKSDWTLFAGIAVPNEYANDFRGLYKVRNTCDFPLFLNISYPMERVSMRHCQTLIGDTSTVLNAESSRFWLLDLPHYLLPQIDGSSAFVTLDNQVYREHLVKDADNRLLRLSYAASLDAQTKKNPAIEAYRAAIGADPSFYVSYCYADAYLGRTVSLNERITFWRQIVQHYPEQYLPVLHLAVALEDNQDTIEAQHTYRKLLEFDFIHAETLKSLERFFENKANIEMAESVHCKLAKVSSQ